MSVSSRRPVAVMVGIIALGSALIGLVQPRLSRDVHRAKQRDDAFLLPPPSQLRAATLGYRAAATDLLWAKLVLEYGLHWQERRPFPDAPRYIDGILALEPSFPTLYQFVDTILVYSPSGGAAEDARLTRRYLERGTRERPYDPDVWLHYGQFCAFLAPSFLKDEAEIEAWRKDGAYALTHAVELGADAQRALAATTILRKSGERKATIEHLQRAYAMADDTDTREQILRKLRALKPAPEEIRAEAEQYLGVVDDEWRQRYGFVTRGTALLLGPSRAPALCAGPASFERRGCPADWDAAVAERR